MVAATVQTPPPPRSSLRVAIACAAWLAGACNQAFGLDPVALQGDASIDPIDGAEACEPVVAAEHGSVAAPAGEHPSNDRSHPGVGNAHRGIRRLTRVGERAEDIEGRGHAKLPAGAGNVPHRRVEPLSKAEGDARLVHDLLDPILRKAQVDAQSLEDVGRT